LFKTKTEARKYAKALRKNRQSRGDLAAALSHRQLLQAQEGFAMLQPYGDDLVFAVKCCRSAIVGAQSVKIRCVSATTLDNEKASLGMTLGYSRLVPPQPDSQRTDPGVFATTHWSIVLEAGRSSAPGAQAALERLCRTYWFPLYAFARRQGNSPEDAQDLTQDFFSRLLEKNYLAKADPDRGKFRTFLLRSLRNFLINEWKRVGRLKRGGGVELLSIDMNAAEDRYAAEAPDRVNLDAEFETRWAVTLIEQVLAVLREEFNAADKVRLFDELKGFIWGEKSTSSYAEIAGELNLSEGTVKVAMHRLRQRFRELLRAEVAHTVARPEDIDGELRHLISVAG
jgi:RNA polymerase sigma factor (sigma-70 family)